MSKRLTAEQLADPFGSGAEIERAMAAAVRYAVMKHKRNGNSIATWRDGHVVVVPAEEIVIPPDPYASETGSANDDRKEAA